MNQNDEENVSVHDRFIHDAVFDALPACIAIVDASGIVIDVNATWRRFGADYGLQAGELILGCNYFELPRFGAHDARDSAATAGIRSVLAGERERFTLEYRHDSPSERRWIRLLSTPLATANGRAAVVMHLDITQERNSAGSLASSEALLQMASSMSRMGGWSVDLPSFVLTWSDEVCAIHDAPPGFAPTVEEAIDFYAPEFRETIRKNFTACTEEGAPFDLELQIITVKGRRVWVRAVGEARRDSSGAIRRVEGAFQDISDRKRHEEEIRHDAERLAGVVSIQQALNTSEESTEELFSTFAAMAMRVLGADGAAFEMVDGEDLVYRAAAGIAARHLGLRHRIAASFSRQAIEQNGSVRCDDTEIDPRADVEGCRRIGFRSTIVAVLRSDSVPIGALKLMASEPGRFDDFDASSLDLIAESFSAVILRRQNAKKLRDSEAHFRLLFAENPQPMCVVDPATLRFLAVNEAAIRFYGYTEAEFLTLTVPQLRASDDLPVLGCESLPMMHASEPRMILATHRTRHGETRELEITFGKIDYFSQNGLLAVATDVTERRRLEAEAARANRSLELLSRCNEALIRADDEATLLRVVCELAVQIGGFPMAWIGFSTDDDRGIVAQVSAGNDEGFPNDAALRDRLWDGGDEMGPAARAIRDGATVLVADLSKEPPFAWREEALRRGFRGTVCLPLSERDRTFGVLVLYLSESRSLTAGEAIRLKELAENLAFGIVTFRARVAQRRIQAAVLAMAQGVSAANGEAFLEKLTASLVASVGADAGFISEFEPGQRNNARIISANVAGERVDVQDFDASEVPCVPEESEDCWLIPRTARRRDPQHPAMSLPPSGALAGIDLKDEHGRAAGMICLLFGETPTDSPLVLSTLRIFASRISAELRRQKADVELVRQAALIDEAPNGIIVEDLDGRIVFWSKGAERLYGWSRADAIGRKSAELFLVNHGWAGTGDALPESGTWAGEQMKTTADGTLVHVESRVTILRDAAGGPGSVLVIDTDITERKKLEEQFLRAQRMESIGTLAGGMAHDLNNALLPILMGASLLKRVVSDSSALTAVGNIERSALRASGLVKQVLSFARGVEGSRAPLAPSLIVNQVRTIVETSIPRSITLETTVQDPLWSIVGDVTQIQQVLLNLCVNARDAMPTGGRMSIAASNAELDAAAIAREGGLVPGRYLKFEVSDTGVGISPDILHRIFEPFFTTKEMVSAPGLGLSTSLGIVRSHGGFFRVVSELGKGSTFTVYLPAMPAATPSAPEPARSLPRGRGQMILLVDDEAAVLSATTETLEAFGYKVVAADNGIHALRLFAEHRREIALVITDIMMPRMDGFELMASIERIDPTVRILGVSGLIEGQTTSRGGHFLPKPYSADAILTKIHEILG